MQIVRVELGERAYDIRIGARLDQFGAALEELNAGRRIAVITDTHVGPLHGSALINSIQVSGRQCFQVEMPAGEMHKNSQTVSTLYDRLFECELDRSSWIVALGGGVVGDVAGFVAATYMRGIPFIQVPTTIVAQVDASIGGKTGYDHPRGKNLIGAFHQPRLVYIDPSLLRTLDRREYIAGLAEVVKHGVIADEELFTYLERHSRDILSMETNALTYAIARSCEYKAYVVAKDERESGLRAKLNYGHTVGHALEAITGYTALLHGEAVAAGMAVEAQVAVEMGLCQEEVTKRQADLLNELSLPVCPPRVNVRETVERMRLDKKTRDGQINPVLPTRIGNADQIRNVSPELIEKVLVKFTS